MTEPDERQGALTQARNLKMTRSAHDYVRGPDGPDCGYAEIATSAIWGVLVQIRDFDQTVIGNPARDFRLRQELREPLCIKMMHTGDPP